MYTLPYTLTYDKWICMFLQVIKSKTSHVKQQNGGRSKRVCLHTNTTATYTCVMRVKWRKKNHNVILKVLSFCKLLCRTVEWCALYGCSKISNPACVIEIQYIFTNNRPNIENLDSHTTATIVVNFVQTFDVVGRYTLGNKLLFQIVVVSIVWCLIPV